MLFRDDTQSTNINDMALDVLSKSIDRIDALEKRLAELGDNNAQKAEEVHKSLDTDELASLRNEVASIKKAINAQPTAQRSVANGVSNGEGLTQEKFKHYQNVMAKSLAAGELDFSRQIMMNTELSKALKLGTPISAETKEFLQGK